MDYISTRGKSKKLDFCEVLLEGLATDGGLYVPISYPQITKKEIAAFAGCSYLETAFKIMEPFVCPSLAAKDFKQAITNALATFRHQAITPLVQIGDNDWLLELFHGPTLAFKDHALQLLGQLFDMLLAKKGERITIVGATSGDTGSAAIEACKNCRLVDIFILHPKGRVSDVQRKQMTTVVADNVFNIAIDGDFDDCQNLVKALFADEVLRRELNLSAINSINWARIMAQIVYYFRAGSLLGSPDKKPYFVVPTGNFGNIFAGYAAHRMGLPISKLVVASNANDILPRFFATSAMTKQVVKPSLSPSMDIQVSSNFERLLFELFSRDAEKTSAAMESFLQKGTYKVDKKTIATAQKIFTSGKCDDENTKAEMQRVYKETGVLIDPHTAVGVFVARTQKRESTEPLIVLSTAHPAKFPDAVKAATGIYPKLPDFMADVLDKKEVYKTLNKDINCLKSFIKSNSKVNQT